MSQDTHLHTWWESDNVPEAVCAVIKRAQERDTNRESAIKRNLGNYLLRNVTDLNSWNYDTVRAPGPDDPRMPLIASVCDSVHAKLMRNVPRTVPITRNGTWTMQRQAQDLEAFIEGVKSRNRFRDTFSDVVLDGALEGDGVAWVHERIDVLKTGTVGRIEIERVFPWQVRVDPLEASYGKPRSKFLELPMDRRVAMAKFPKHADAIEKAQRVDRGASYHSHADQVMILIGWHLPSVKGAGDGIEVVVCEGVKEPLRTRPWTLDMFPLAHFRWKRPRIGYWGHSLADGIAGIHETLNETDETIRSRMAQSFGVLVNRGGEATEMTVDNSREVLVISAPGTDKEMLEYYSPNLVSAEHFNERQNLFDYGYRFSGASQLSAAGMKPAGLDSGVALREHQDIETERFTVQGEEMERFDRDVTVLIVEIARELAEQGINIEVEHKTKRRRKPVVKRIRWKDISLKEADFTLDTSPASQIPRELSGQVALAEQMIAAGIIRRPDDAARLIDHPDIEAVLHQQLAPYYIILDLIEDMLEDNKARSPIPEMDLDMTQQIARLAILQATIDEVPEERIGLVRAFVEQARTLQQRAAQQEAMAAAAAAGPNPMAGGGNPEGAFVPNPAGALQPGLPTNAAPQGAPVM